MICIQKFIGWNEEKKYHQQCIPLTKCLRYHLFPHQSFIMMMMMIDDGDDHLSDFLIRASVQYKIGVHQLLPLLLPTFQSRSWDFLNQDLKPKSFKNLQFLPQRSKVYWHISNLISCLRILSPMREVAAALLFWLCFEVQSWPGFPRELYLTLNKMVPWWWF